MDITVREVRARRISEHGFNADGTADLAGAGGLLPELDEYAVERALQIKEELGDDTEVTTISVRPEDVLWPPVVRVHGSMMASASAGVLRTPAVAHGPFGKSKTSARTAAARLW